MSPGPRAAVGPRRHRREGARRDGGRWAARPRSPRNSGRHPDGRPRTEPLTLVYGCPDAASDQPRGTACALLGGCRINRSTTRRVNQSRDNSARAGPWPIAVGRIRQETQIQSASPTVASTTAFQLFTRQPPRHTSVASHASPSAARAAESEFAPAAIRSRSVSVSGKARLVDRGDALHRPPPCCRRVPESADRGSDSPIARYENRIPEQNPRCSTHNPSRAN